MKNWLTSTDVFRMAAEVYSDRKLRLFGCACCRRWPTHLNAWGLELLEAAEGYADGLVNAEHLEALRSRLEGSLHYASRYERSVFMKFAAVAAADTDPAGPVVAAYMAALPRDRSVSEGPRTLQEVSREKWRRAWYDFSNGVVLFLSRFLPRWFFWPRAEAQAQADLLRDIWNPSPPAMPTILGVHGDLVSHLATAAYEERCPSSGHLETGRLAVLADALEEAGVGGPLLAHLRSAGPHVRGCWPVDLLLGKG